LTHPGLRDTDLLQLVRRERRLEARVAPLADLAELAKATRKRIDQLLVAAGFQPKESTTCAGYQLTHTKRAGQTSFNDEKARAKFVAAGVEPELVDEILAACFETGDDALFVLIRPMRGALVRKRAEPKPLARKSLKEAA
jgi:hypothetical protein